MSLDPPLTGSMTRRVRRERASARSPRLLPRSFIAEALTSQYAKIHSGSRTRRRTRFTPYDSGKRNRSSSKTFFGSSRGRYLAARIWSSSLSPATDRRARSSAAAPRRRAAAALVGMPAGFFGAVFVTTAFLAAGFLAAGFFTAAFCKSDFAGAGFVAAGFRTAAFAGAAFFTAALFAAALPAPGLFTAGFFAAGLTAAFFRAAAFAGAAFFFAAPAFVLLLAIGGQYTTRGKGPTRAAAAVPREGPCAAAPGS